MLLLQYLQSNCFPTKTLTTTLTLITFKLFFYFEFKFIKMKLFCSVVCYITFFFKTSPKNIFIIVLILFILKCIVIIWSSVDMATISTLYVDQYENATFQEIGFPSEVFTLRFLTSF